MQNIQQVAPISVPGQTVCFQGQRYGLSAVFEPVRNPYGRLVAVEMLSRLRAVSDATPALAPALFYAQAPPSQLRKALRAQVNCLRLCLPWFRAHGVLVSLNVNRTLAPLIINDPWMAVGLAGMQPWLRLEISEHFLQPEAGAEDDLMLDALAHLAPLWLDDFGTGSASLSALLARRFEAVKLDVGVFAALCHSRDGRAFLLSLSKVAQHYGAWMIAEGVESATQWAHARRLGLWAGQGWRWPGVGPEALTTLRLQDEGVIAVDDRRVTG